jgi:hypothetical protein
MFLVYQNKRYRSAAVPALTGKDKERQLLNVNDDAGNPGLAEAKAAGEKLLGAYQISYTPTFSILKEADGYDIIYVLPKVKIDATLRLDYGVKTKAIQEVEFKLYCTPPYSFVAQKPQDIKELMLCVNALQKAKARPAQLELLRETAETPDEQANVRKEWATSLVMQMSAHGVKIDFGDQKQVVKALEKYEDIEEDVREQAKTIVMEFKEQAWKDLVKEVQEQGNIAVSNRALVEAAIKEITQHEDFTISPATYTINAYHPDGSMIVSLDTALPIVLVLDRANNKMVLKSLLLFVCKIEYDSGPDLTLAKTLFSVMVSLVLAGDRAANPSLSKSPDKNKLNWDPEELSTFIDTGVGRRLNLDRSISFMADNSAVRTEMEPNEGWIERTEQNIQNMILNAIKERKPAYWYSANMLNSTVSVYRAPGRHIEADRVQTFYNVDHEYNDDLNDQLKMRGIITKPKGTEAQQEVKQYTPAGPTTR